LNRLSGDNNGNEMEKDRIAGRRAASMFDPFASPATAFHTRIKHDKAGKAREMYEG